MKAKKMTIMMTVHGVASCKLIHGIKCYANHWVNQKENIRFNDFNNSLRFGYAQFKLRF